MDARSLLWRYRISIQDIVRESGISAGLVYRYFTGKDDMIVAIATEWHEPRRTLIEPGPADPDGPRDPGELAGVYLDLLRSVGRPGALDVGRHRGPRRLRAHRGIAPRPAHPLIAPGASTGTQSRCLPVMLSPEERPRTRR